MAKPEKKDKISNNENTVENVTENTINNQIINESEILEQKNNDSQNNDSQNNDSQNNDSQNDDSQNINTQSTINSTVASPSNVDLLKIIENLQKQVEVLSKNNSQSNTEEIKQNKQNTIIPMPIPMNNSTLDSTAKLVEYLASKKSDKEITIVHNQEKIGGLSTAIKLTGMSIEFHTMGEQRVLSYQQFEECVSIYKKWFDKKIILLSYEDRELAERYGVHYVGEDGKLSLSRENLRTLGKLTVEQLQDFYLRLCEEDQKHLCSYWIGKCYEKNSDYYNRYKIECLARLSDSGVFDNILTNMNYEFMNINKNNDKTAPIENPTRQIPRIDADKF